MAAKLVYLMAVTLLAHGALAHTYFKAEMVPFGDQAYDAPDSSGVLDFYTHKGEIFWTLNVSDVQGMYAAKIVYGDPDIGSEDVVTYVSLDAPTNFTAQGFEGVFNATQFELEYPWTVDGLRANAGLHHLWAVVVNDADYNNVVLAAPLEHYVPAAEAEGGSQAASNSSAPPPALALAAPPSAAGAAAPVSMVAAALAALALALLM